MLDGELAQAGGHRPGNEPVHHLREQDADDDRKLVEADQAAANGGRAGFRDVNRRDVGAEADSKSAGNAPSDELQKGLRLSGEHRGEGKKDSGGEEHTAAAVAVGKRTS